MTIRTLDFRETMPGNFSLFLWGDTHIGNIQTSYGVIEKFVRKVRSHKNGFCSFGGDQLECKSPRSAHYNVDVHPNNLTRVNDQRDKFIALTSNLAGKTLWILDGNHEMKVPVSNELYLTGDIMKALDTPYQWKNPCYLVKALFPGFRLLDWHGMGGVNSQAGDPHQRERNDCVKVKRKLRDLPGHDCAVQVMHHIHKMRITEPISHLKAITDPDNLELIQSYTVPRRMWVDEANDIYIMHEDDIWYASSGSALRTYKEGISGYGEVAGYRLTELGCIKVTVKDNLVSNVEKVVL